MVKGKRPAYKKKFEELLLRVRMLEDIIAYNTEIKVGNYVDKEW